MYKTIESKNSIQIELHPTLKTIKVQEPRKSLTFMQKRNFYFIQLIKNQLKGSSKEYGHLISDKTSL